MKTPSERGRVGAWAFETRQARGLSVEEVVDALGARGHTVRPATIRGIESGVKGPSRRLLALLGEVLGSEPPQPAPPLSVDEVAAAIDRQTAAIERQNEVVVRILEVLARVAVTPRAPTEGEFPELRALRRVFEHEATELEESSESRHIE